MGYDGYGNFTRDFNWEEDAANSILITASRMDAEFDNFAAGMNSVILRNGVAPMQGDLKMGNNRITGLADGSAASPTIQSTVDAATGFFFPTPGVLAFSVAGTERGRFVAAGFTTQNRIGVGTATPRSALDIVGGLAAFEGQFEKVSIQAVALTGAINLDYKTAPVFMFTPNATGNWTFNIRGDSATSLNSLMDIGQMCTVAIEAPQGATAYYCTGITVDGNAPGSLKWAGATGAPTNGHPNSIDVYLIRITKTADAVFQVRASQSQEK